MHNSANETVPLIIRGDLRSETGYGRSTRALLGLCGGFKGLSMYGVDLHHNPEDCSSPFPYPVINDIQMWQMVRESARTPIILHCVGIDDFVRVPGAINIGAFYWETDAIVHERHWPLRLSQMDRIWAPTSWLAAYARSCGFRGDITILPWPHKFPEKAPATSIDTLDGISALHFTGQSVKLYNYSHVKVASLREIRLKSRNIFVSVQSLAPRKGLPILLREWRSYIEDPSCNDVLVLRLAFRHMHGIASNHVEHFEDILRMIGFDGVNPRIAVIHDHLSERQLSGLYGACDAYISASYGEGFGGPIIEALTAHRPVIAPRHTGIADLLPSGYPLTVATTRKCVGLKGNLAAYPHSSTWHLPLPGEVLGRLREFAAMTSADRTSVMRQAQTHAAKFCSLQAVMGIIGAEIHNLLHPEHSGSVNFLPDRLPQNPPQHPDQKHPEVLEKIGFTKLAPGTLL